MRGLAAAAILLLVSSTMGCKITGPETGDSELDTIEKQIADLIGAAAGTLVTSVVLIPFLGIIWAAIALMGLKMISLVLIGTAKVDNL